MHWNWLISEHTVYYDNHRSFRAKFLGYQQIKIDLPIFVCVTFISEMSLLVISNELRNVKYISGLLRILPIIKKKKLDKIT